MKKRIIKEDEMQELSKLLTSLQDALSKANNQVDKNANNNIAYFIERAERLSKQISCIVNCVEPFEWHGITMP